MICDERSTLLNPKKDIFGTDSYLKGYLIVTSLEWQKKQNNWVFSTFFLKMLNNLNTFKERQCNVRFEVKLMTTMVKVNTMQKFILIVRAKTLLIFVKEVS